jgi:hypothetical protein
MIYCPSVPVGITWGRNEQYLIADGSSASLADLLEAELHLLDTGYMATATPSAEIAERIAALLPTHDHAGH